MTPTSLTRLRAVLREPWLTGSERTDIELIVWPIAVCNLYLGQEVDVRGMEPYILGETVHMS